MFKTALTATIAAALIACGTASAAPAASMRECATMGKTGHVYAGATTSCDLAKRTVVAWGDQVGNDSARSARVTVELPSGVAYTMRCVYRPSGRKALDCSYRAYGLSLRVTVTGERTS